MGSEGIVYECWPFQVIQAMILYLCSTIVLNEGELSLKSFVFDSHIIEEKRKLNS